MKSKVNRLGLGSLAFGHLVVDMQTSSLAVMIPFLYVTFNLDYAGAALIVTLNSISSSVIQPFFGLLSDKKSMLWLLPLGPFITAGGMVLVLFMPNYWLVLLVVIFSGLGSAAFHPEGSRNANYVSGEKKGTGLSIFFVGGNLGFAIGPIAATALIGIFGPPGILAFLVPGLIGSLLLWSLLPLFKVHAAQTSLNQKNKNFLPASQKPVLKPLAFLISIISLRAMTQTGLITFIPLYFISLSSNNKGYAAFLLSVFVFSGAIGTLVGGRLSDKMDRKLLMAGSLFIVTPALILFLNSSGLIQVLAVAVAGSTLISASTLQVVMAQELLPRRVGLASGLTLGLGFGAGGLGASVLGKFADIFGLPQTMGVLAVIPLLVVGLCLLMPGTGKRIQFSPSPVEVEIAQPAPVMSAKS